MQAPTSTEIDGFWNWFVAASDRLAGDSVDKVMLARLDASVRALGPVTWEIGPGLAKANGFVVSPDGNASVLPVTRLIVSQAPVLKAWEFFPAKPPKVWDLQFALRHVGEPNVQVDAREWRYLLYEFPDGMLDIDILAPSLLSCDPDLRVIAAETVLDGILGEERRLERIAGVSVSLRIADRVVARKYGEMQLLSKHLESLPQ